MKFSGAKKEAETENSSGEHFCGYLCVPRGEACQRSWCLGQSGFDWRSRTTMSSWGGGRSWSREGQRQTTWSHWGWIGDCLSLTTSKLTLVMTQEDLSGSWCPLARRRFWVHHTWELEPRHLHQAPNPNSRGFQGHLEISYGIFK